MKKDELINKRLALAKINFFGDFNNFTRYVAQKKIDVEKLEKTKEAIKEQIQNNYSNLTNDGLKILYEKLGHNPKSCEECGIYFVDHSKGNVARFCCESCRGINWKKKTNYYNEHRKANKTNWKETKRNKDKSTATTRWGVFVKSRTKKKGLKAP